MRRPPALSAPAIPMKIVTSSLEHLLPDAMRDAEGAPLERNALHLFEKLVGLHLWIDGEGLDRHLQEAGALFHA